MLIHPADPAHPLVEPGDLESPDAPPLPAVLAAYEEPLRRTLTWAREYLCNPHPELGRKGDVCPFVGTAIKRSTFYMTVWPGVPSDRAEVTAVLQRFRSWFSELDPKDGAAAQFKTMLVIFPDLPDDVIPHVIDATQDELKGEYVEVGLMLGEFHAGPPDKAGLWNEDFRPLNSPVPLLAIRHMVTTDFPFLRDEPDYVRSYLRLFGHRVPTHLQEDVAATVARHALAGPTAPHVSIDDLVVADIVADPEPVIELGELANETLPVQAPPLADLTVHLAAGVTAPATAEVPANLQLACPVTEIDPAIPIALTPAVPVPAQPGEPAAAGRCPVDHGTHAAAAAP